MDELVAGSRRAGVRLTYHVTGTEQDVPGAVQVCAYRLVQEALSNATRHAAGGPVDVTVEVTPDRVGLRVHNGPGTDRGPAVRRAGGSGHGLVGMRERVALLGGELHLGPDPDGGFTVAADLPVAVPAPAGVGPEYDAGSGSTG
ncbi:sensor histidine kinase [Actinocatenispora thailandica]|uniref:sensor histidine kinase n=1 Tax=Actinocatenispora thailandica TaxID=227318 RepID=UPI00194DD9CF|nr:ATP-binding protein [Actinocatenispora thailandica]